MRTYVLYAYTHISCIIIIKFCIIYVADKTSPPVVPDDGGNTNPTAPSK